MKVNLLFTQECHLYIYCRDVIDVCAHEGWFNQVGLYNCAGGPGVSWQDRGVSRQGRVRPLRCKYRVLLGPIKVLQHLRDCTALICYMCLYLRLHRAHC